MHNKRNIHEKWSYNHLRHRWWGWWWWFDHNKPDHRKKGNRNSIDVFLLLLRLSWRSTVYIVFWQKKCNWKKAFSHLFDVTSEYLPMINDLKFSGNLKTKLVIWYKKWAVEPPRLSETREIHNMGSYFRSEHLSVFLAHCYERMCVCVCGSFIAIKNIPKDSIRTEKLKARLIGAWTLSNQCEHLLLDCLFMIRQYKMLCSRFILWWRVCLEHFLKGWWIIVLTCTKDLIE